MPLSRPVTFAALALLASLSQAQQWHSPHPWRADAVLQGREQEYNHERFLHSFSYRHLQPRPSEWENGIRGTGGSITSKTLLLDVQYRQDFLFANEATAFTLDIQRSEDFDGAYDRQLVGFRHTLAEHRQLPGKGRWQLSLQGDVFADKSRSDVYFGGRYLTDSGGWLAATWILPDAYFNDKGGDDSEFIDAPYSYFLQWHQPHQHGATTISINHSPRSRLDSRSAESRVASEQTRAALHHQQQYGEWLWQGQLEGEYTRRTHHLDEENAALPFHRDMAAATTSLQHLSGRGMPTLGLRYFWLQEEGWFGRAINSNGSIDRREPLLFASLNLAMGEQQQLTPTVYLSTPRVRQQTDNDQWRERDSDNWIGKLSLPWQWQIHPQQQATLTVAPAFRLHRAAFGGGNIQLHWPL